MYKPVKFDRRIKLSKEDLSNLAWDLRNGTDTFAVLGEKYNISRQRVSQINFDRFKVDPWPRCYLRKKAKHALVDNHLVIGLYDKPIQGFIRKALANGLTVLPHVLRERPGEYLIGIATTAIKVNGKLCRMHVVTKPHVLYVTKGGRPTSYYVLSPTNGAYFSNAPFKILIAGEKRPRYFIIPKRAIRTSSVNIPAHERSGYNNRRPKVEYLKYENRFDLLY